MNELYIQSDNWKEIIRPYSPWENGEIESFFSCIERELFQRFEVEDFEELKVLVDEYVK